MTANPPDSITQVSGAGTAYAKNADEKKPRFALSAILSALRLTGVFLL